MENNKLTSKSLLLWNSGFSIAVNLFKAVWVFQAVSFTNTSIITIIYSILAMAIVEFSIIVFLANGKTKDSIGFAILSVVINLYYFNGLQFDNWRLNVVHVIFSFLLPYISARMAHVYIKRMEQQDQPEEDTIPQKEYDLLYQENKANEQTLGMYSNMYFDEKERADRLEEVVEEVRTLEDQQRSKVKRMEKELQKQKKLVKKAENKGCECKESKKVENKVEQLSMF